jgi:UDP-glucose 4-epimerase
MSSGVVLVTGGAGFIGSHVVDRLLDNGQRVRVLDNLSTGRQENLSHREGQVEWHIGDICEREDVLRALAEVDSVVHLAALPSVPHSIEHPQATHSVNYGGTLQLLEAMRISGVKRIIYASSAAVYRPFGNQPHREDELPDPSSPYGVDKLAGEFTLAVYARLHGFKSTSLRFFNVYGERQDPASAYSGVITIFVNRIRQGLPITVNGDGNQTRDFVYVKDLASLIVDLLPRTPTDQVLNVGKGQSETLNELIRILGELLGRPADVQYGPNRVGDIRESLADIGRITDLGYGQWTSLEDGLRQTLSEI